MTIDVSLENLYYEDKKERESDITQDALTLHTKERLQKVKEILPQIDLSEIWNCHYLAYLLHHSESKEDYTLAHKYAKKAVEMGSNVTKWLYVATLDRLLISQGNKQKFGTQFKKQGDEWIQLPVDETVTDKEREEYGVPPLDKSYEVFMKKYNRG